MTARRLLAPCCLVAMLAAIAVQAHEVRPAYLELRGVDAERWDVLWKVPAKGDRRLGLDVRLPPRCRSDDAIARFTSGAHVQRWRATCPGGLLGATVAIDGLADTRTDVLVRIDRSDGTSQTWRLTSDEPAFTVTAAAGATGVATTYVELGVEHILVGIDHLFFVLALLFLADGTRRLLGTVTAFTVAHSVTLAAATLGWLDVPAAPVEAVIALSIVFVAAEVVHASQGRFGVARRRPWIAAFAFGLLHGFGFAGALRQVGLPEHAIPLALACFNVGVELGQLVFVAAVMGSFWLVGLTAGRLARRDGVPVWSVARAGAWPAAYAIGVVAAFWTIDRTVRFWPSDTWAAERPVVPRTADAAPGTTIGAWDRRHPG